MSYPHILAAQDVRVTSPANIFIKVDFPAPFGPKSPKKDPPGTLRLTLFRAGEVGVLF